MTKQVSPFSRKYKNLLQSQFIPILTNSLNQINKNFSFFNLTYGQCIQNSTCKDILSMGVKFIDRVETVNKIQIPQLGDLT